MSPEKPFLSDTDFEKLKADVLAGGASVSLSPPSLVSQGLGSQGLGSQGPLGNSVNVGPMPIGQPGGVVMGGPNNNNNNFAPPNSIHPVTMGPAPFKV